MKPPKQTFKIGADEYSVPKVAAGSAPTPLPPSVEEAYRRKCIELKKRMTEVEESNDASRLRKVRLGRGIRKMRLERAYLLEMLSKRMKKNGASLDGFYDEDSEGSSEGPPTPHDRPLRSKRSHRRPIGSPPPPMEYSMSQQHPGYQGPYDPPPHQQHESPYGPAPHSNGPNGPNGLSHSAQYPQHPHVPLPQPPILASNHTGPSPSHVPSQNTLLSPIPAPEPFAMFFENNYLSQPHKHSGARTENDLLALAQTHWESPDYETQRRMYEAQANKQRARYEESSRGYEIAAQQQIQARQGGRTIQPKVDPEEEEGKIEGAAGRDEMAEKEAERDDVEMKDAGASGGAGGFTSINR